MSRSCGSDDKAIKGGEWTKVLHYTPNATKPGDSAIKVPDENLKSYFANVDGTGDAIVKVKIYKNNLCGGWVPKVAGLWHEFTVVESTNWYWSFEKNDYGICVQRGKDEKYVKNYYRGSERAGNVAPEGRDPQSGRKGDTMYDVFVWLYRKDYLNEGYHLTDSNCHYFASLLFEAIACQKGRKLK